SFSPSSASSGRSGAFLKRRSSTPRVGDHVPGVEAAQGVPPSALVAAAQHLVEEGQGRAPDVVVRPGHHQPHGPHPGRLDGAAVVPRQGGQLGDCLIVFALTKGDVQGVFEDEPHRVQRVPPRTKDMAVGAPTRVLLTLRAVPTFPAKRPRSFRLLRLLPPYRQVPWTT